MNQLQVPLRLMNLYPPLLGAGIRVKEVSAAYDRVVVDMKLTWWNANFARTHFGGSLYMMIDPFYALMLKRQLGAGYVVWDREATIHFRTPGRSNVRAVFQLAPAAVAGYRAELEQHGKLDVVLPIEIHDDAGTVIAQASKVIYARRTDRPQNPNNAPRETPAPTGQARLPGRPRDRGWLPPWNNLRTHMVLSPRLCVVAAPAVSVAATRYAPSPTRSSTSRAWRPATWNGRQSLSISKS